MLQQPAALMKCSQGATELYLDAMRFLLAMLLKPSSGLPLLFLRREKSVFVMQF